MLERLTPWLLGAAMVLVAAMSFVLRPTPHIDPSFSLDRAVPSTFGDWRIDPDTVLIPPSPDVQANLDKIYDQILTRTYVNGTGQRMMLVVAYGGDQSDSLKAHRQEVCYAAQGFSVKDVQLDVLSVGGAGVPVVRMHALKPRRSEPVTYWFTMGEQVAMGRAERFYAQIVYGLAGKVPDGLLVRVSNLSSDTDQSYAQQAEFLRALLQSVDAKTRLKLAGLR